MTFILGDCNHILKDTDDNSIDLIVTDPPYGIEFMGKDWDKALVPTETWKECYRVLKQGKLAFIMCSPRQDVLSRMIVNLQDAGFRTNYTSIYWTFASGFPKAANISKLIDKKNGRDEPVRKQFAEYLESKRINAKVTHAKIHHHLGKKNHGGGLVAHWKPDAIEPGVPTLEDWNKLKEIIDLGKDWDWFVERKEAEREIIRTEKRSRSETSNYSMPMMGAKSKIIDINITKPATEEAKKMEGAYVGFQPKPAVEVVLVVSKGKTLTWLDDCRIPYQSEDDKDGATFGIAGYNKWNEWKYNQGDRPNTNQHSYVIKNKEGNEKGRFPANLLVSDDCLNDGKITKSGKAINHNRKGNKSHSVYGDYTKMNEYPDIGYPDEGSYSRYFSLDQWTEKTFPFLIVPKASRSERGEFNTHATVKPLKLMSYLITMGSREGDLVLDPFCGSGTICIAAEQLHRRWIGIELNPEYMEICKKRIQPLLNQLKII